MTEKNVLEGVLDHLQTMVSSNILLSDPIESGNRSIFTISSVGFGFGGGEGRSNDGGAGAAGAGAGVTPIAVMVIHKDIPGAEGVQIFTLGKKGEVAQAISTAAESLPSVIDALRSPKKE
ncbi:putative spore protein YtfJ [Methanocalculus alkaliphilus]|uniref:spore germination protein GerW family protein n=1 Tax=Methanocalculus alkaliphilus TaxID=768730 RepID=UPI00209ECCAA|nr:spore germination protein GerW family protein [Methanocalculus alkaliphilus]MCP1716158.1 putative spore protein YtfJ [Methanocalculus alkaliphilus]